MIDIQLDDNQIQLLKSSAKALMPKGPAIADRLYAIIFREHPELRYMFSPSIVPKTDETDEENPTLWSKAMAHIFFNFVAHISEIEKYERDMERISYKHVSREVKPEYYAVMGDCLISAIQDVVGTGYEEVLNCWRHAFDVMTSKFIEREVVIRNELRETPGKWEGFRKFVVVCRKEEHLDDFLSDVNSDEDEPEAEPLPDGCHKKFYFHLEPVDGNRQMPEFVPEQHVCIRYATDVGIVHRNYTLETITDSQIVVACKCEHIDPAMASGYMRDNWKNGFEVEISAPNGSFLLIESLEVS